MCGRGLRLILNDDFITQNQLGIINIILSLRLNK